MKHTWYGKHLAVLLCVCLLAGLMPPAARAADPAPTEISVWNALGKAGQSTVYQLDATVYAAYDEESGGVYLGQFAEITTAPDGTISDDNTFRILVVPTADDLALKNARSGDAVVVQGRVEAGPRLVATAPSQVTESPLRGLEDGGTYYWTGGGRLVVPEGITKLTIQGDGSLMSDACIEAPFGGLDLTIADLKLSGTPDLSVVVCPYGSLTVRGDCVVESSANSALGGLGTITVEKGATLTINSEGAGFVQTIETSPGGLRLHNDGEVRVTTKWGGIATGRSFHLEGSGSTWIKSETRYALFANDLAELDGNGSVTLIGSDPDYGAGIRSNAGGLEIKVGEQVTGLIVGGILDGYKKPDGSLITRSYDPVGGMVVVALPNSPAGKQNSQLDLSGENAAQTWLYKNESGDIIGTAAWTPAAGDTPAQFTLVSAVQSNYSKGLFLSGGVVFPENIAVEIAMSANTEISNSDGPAVSAPGGKLTFTTPYMGDGAQPSLHRSEDQVAISAAPGGSVSFAGGNFDVFGYEGTADVPIRVEKGLGTVRLNAEDKPAAPEGVTVDPAVVSRAGTADRHAELKDGAGTHLGDSPSNYAISYNGQDGYLVASILPSRLPEPEPTPAPTPSTGTVSESRETTYAVVYHPGYDGPRNVREGGHSRGDRVTVQTNPFDAPRGMEFAGWSGEEGGAVLHQPGERLSMPYSDLHLYAVWTGTAAPALNRAEHMAYLTGYPNGNAGPADLITREQTAVIFYRLLDAASRAQYHSASSPFPDVADSRWSALAIATMANAGILKGLPDGTFAPETPITRGEFAAIAARFDSDGYSGAHLFPDIAGHWAAGEIDRAAQKGWVKGDQAGNFRPDAPITRAEAAALINRVLERAPQTAADLLSGMKAFPDNADPAAWYYLDIQEAANGHEFQRKPDGVHETWTELTPDDF